MSLSKKCNPDTSSKAHYFLKLITSFHFIVSMVITRSDFDMTLPVTYSLHSKTIYILTGYNLIDSLKNLITADHISFERSLC